MADTHPDCPPKDWVNIIFLTLTPILGLPVLVLYTLWTGFHFWMPLLFLALYIPVGLSICAGYHRYFAHRTYECSRFLQLFYAVFGAMAAQNSILHWSSGHRRHHVHVDSDWDPYSIARGFWWAHIIWVFYAEPSVDRLENVQDLRKNPIVRWQQRWYLVLLIVAGFGLPTLIGALCGDAIAGLLWGGFLRVVVVHHSTFFVNSLAHHVGVQTYNEAVSARDNWAVALLTFGEGYHSFHHRFPGDFRNGVPWYTWDPAKWFICGLQSFGLAHSLRATAPPLIEQARIKVAAAQLETRLTQAGPVRGQELRDRIERACQAYSDTLALWRKYADERKKARADLWRKTYRAYRLHLTQARNEWRCALRAVRKCQI